MAGEGSTGLLQKGRRQPSTPAELFGSFRGGGRSWGPVAEGPELEKARRASFPRRGGRTSMTSDRARAGDRPCRYERSGFFGLFENGAPPCCGCGRAIDAEQHDGVHFAEHLPRSTR